MSAMSSKFPVNPEQEGDEKYITAEEKEYFAKAIKDHLQLIQPQSGGMSDNQPPSRKQFFVANSDIEVDPNRDPHEEDSFKRAGLQNGVMTKLISGKFRPQDELDLHGMQVAEAGQSLANFMNDAYQEGAECVIVIHGKGSAKNHSDTHRPGKLKSYVIEWLKNNDMILGFCRALTQDGGSGATYILLSK